MTPYQVKLVCGFYFNNIWHSLAVRQLSVWSVLAIVPEGGSLQHWESVPSLVHLITISPSQCTFSWGDKLHLHCAMVLHLTSESLPIVHLHFQTSLQSNSPLYSNVHCTALRLRKAAPSPFFLCQRGWSRQGDNCETTDRADCETIYRVGTRGLIRRHESGHFRPPLQLFWQGLL